MESDTKRLLARLYSGFRLLVVIAICVYLILLVAGGRSALREVELTESAGPLSIAFLLAILGYQLLPIAWIVMLKRARLYKRERLAWLYRVWWVSYMYRYVPGKFMLVVERVRLGSEAGIPRSIGAALPVVETLVAIAAGCSVALFAVTSVSAEAQSVIPFAAAITIGVLAILPVVIRRLILWPFFGDRFPQLNSLSFGYFDFLGLFLLYVAHYLILGASLFFIANAFSPIAISKLLAMCGMFALSHVLGLIVVIAPAGLGIREGSLAALLQMIVQPVFAGMVAIVSRVCFTLAEVLSLLTVLAHDQIVRRRSTDNPSILP